MASDIAIAKPISELAPEISRWAFTQTTREVVCPRCNAQPGDHCRTPRGRETLTPHVERCRAYHDKIGKAEWERRHFCQRGV